VGGAQRRPTRLPLWPLMMAAGVCEGVCRPLGIEPPLHRRRADFFVKNRAFSIEKARRVLGWRPQVNPESGLKQTALWYAQQGMLGPVPRDVRPLPRLVQEVAS
jgi:dihydroflavonol-4-reductase